jgi:hypothetical protein
MHSGFIGSVHRLSSWTPPGRNNGAVSARLAPMWPLVAPPQLEDSLSDPDQRQRRRRMEAIRSSAVAIAGSGQSLPLALSSLPW